MMRHYPDLGSASDWMKQIRTVLWILSYKYTVTYDRRIARSLFYIIVSTAQHIIKYPSSISLTDLCRKFEGPLLARLF